MVCVRERNRGKTAVKILIADDDPCSLVFAQGILTKAGHSTRAVTNPEEAFQIIQEAQYSEAPYNMAIADHYLQHMTGIELLGKIRSISPDFPVIMTCGYDHSCAGRREQDALGEKCIHLMKPFGSEELLASIEMARSGIGMYR